VTGVDVTGGQNERHGNSTSTPAADREEPDGRPDGQTEDREEPDGRPDGQTEDREEPDGGPVTSGPDTLASRFTGGRARQSHSRRSASIGSTRAARQAGYSPETMPTRMPTATAMTAQSSG
jgi:hypothetical protein